MPTIPSAININEYMPKKLYDLKSSVYKKSKEKANDLVMYMKEGIIYFGRKGERLSTAIFSTNDLHKYLGLTLPTMESKISRTCFIKFMFVSCHLYAY